MKYGTLSKISERRIEHFSCDPEISGFEPFIVVKEAEVACALLFACKEELSCRDLAIESLRDCGGLLFYASSPAITAAREILNKRQNNATA